MGRGQRKRIRGKKTNNEDVEGERKEKRRGEEKEREEMKGMERREGGLKNETGCYMEEKGKKDMQERERE